jgi:hypothetical protein
LLPFVKQLLAAQPDVTSATSLTLCFSAEQQQRRAVIA